MNYVLYTVSVCGRLFHWRIFPGKFWMSWCLLFFFQFKLNKWFPAGGAKILHNTLWKNINRINSRKKSSPMYIDKKISKEKTTSKKHEPHTIFKPSIAWFRQFFDLGSTQQTKVSNNESTKPLTSPFPFCRFFLYTDNFYGPSEPQIELAQKSHQRRKTKNWSKRRKEPQFALLYSWGVFRSLAATRFAAFCLEF